MPEWLISLGLFALGTGGIGSIYALVNLFARRKGIPLEHSAVVASTVLVDAQARHEIEKAETLRRARWESDWARQEAQMDAQSQRQDALEKRSDKQAERMNDLEADLDVAMRDKMRLRKGLNVTINFVQIDVIPLVPDASVIRYPEGWDEIKRIAQGA